MYLNSSIIEQLNRIEQQCKSIKPVVVIQCLAYNHEPFIRDALDGFVMQKTDFPFVAIVHDDASTDKTAEIIREYSEKYPDIILPIFEKENLYSKRDGSIRRIMDEACKVTGAKYIALCEGDDYWIDPMKLQKQVDFLDSNPEYSMCFHSANLKYEDSIQKNNKLESDYDNLQQREYSIDEIHRAFIVPTCSVLFRKEVLNQYKNSSDYCVGDNVIWTTCAVCGRIFCFTEKMATYRINNEGWTIIHSKSREYRIGLYKKWFLHYKALRYNYPDVNSTQIYLNEIKYAAIVTYTDINPLTNVLNNFIRFFKDYKIYYIKSLSINICRTLYHQTKRFLGL